VLELEPNGLRIGKFRLKSYHKNLQIKFTMSKVGQDVLLKRNNCTTLILSSLAMDESALTLVH
jgi:hypothetical protein